jgi:hypothetical protein
MSWWPLILAMIASRLRHWRKSGVNDGTDYLVLTGLTTRNKKRADNKKAAKLPEISHLAALTVQRWMLLDLLLVPMAGVEPARLSPLPPQDSVSTNSTTSAC